MDSYTEHLEWTNMKEQISQLLEEFVGVSQIEEQSQNTYHIAFGDPVAAYLVKTGFDNLEIAELGVKFQIH